jgi:leucine dehydrogenase
MHTTQSDVDAVCPCAVGALLNPETIPQIKARVICGAANNQLLDMARDSQLLHERGIYYIPDFLVNRMGIVCCADEHIGYIIPREQDPNVQKHLGTEWEHSIYNLTVRILKQSTIDKCAPQKVCPILLDY